MNGHEKRNLRLVRELSDRGHDVSHACPGPGLAHHGFTGTTFGEEFFDDPDFRDTGTHFIDNWRDLFRRINACDTVLFGAGKGYRAAAEYASRTGKIVLYHRDIGADHFWADYSNMAAARGSFEISHTAQRGGLPEDRIRITGCVQFDDAVPGAGRLDRTAFCAKYGLDPSKKIVLVFSSNPAGHSPATREITRRACHDVAAINGYQVMIKPHPREYAGLKLHQHYEDTETPTWIQTAPGIPALEPADKYDAFRHSEVFIASYYSALGKETALFGKALIYLESPERFAEQTGVDIETVRKVLPPTLATACSRRPLQAFGTVTSALAQHREFAESQYWKKMHFGSELCYGEKIPDYIGLDCWIDELSDVIRDRLYVPSSDIDFDSYIEEYCYANDGMAYYRVANMVEEAPGHPSIRRAVRQQKGLFGLRSLIYRWRVPL